MNSRMKKLGSGLSPVKCQWSNVKCSQEGFTLLELLIVISIIAILSVALIFVINPAETLRKSRDAQRISDLSALKTALGLYTTSTTTPYIGGLANNNGCKATPTTGWTTSATGPFIYYSLPVSGIITDPTLDNSVTTTVASTTAQTNYTLTDGTGWIPVNFDSLIGGSPISNLPIDPVNALASGEAGAVSTSTLAYRYACSKSPLAYEIDTVLESETYTTGSDNKLTKDGGNSDNYFEVGTNLRILGAGTSSISMF